MIYKVYLDGNYVGFVRARGREAAKQKFAKNGKHPAERYVARTEEELSPAEEDLAKRGYLTEAYLATKRWPT